MNVPTKPHTHRYHSKYTHLNHEGVLPPVDCPIMIEVPGCGVVRAERTCHVADKDNQMEYRLVDGSKIMGRFRWTYP